MSKRNAWLILALYGAALGISLVTYASSDDDRYLAVALSLLPVMILGLTAVRLKEADAFSPLYLVGYLAFFSVTMKTAYLCFYDTGISRYISLDGRDLSILLGGTVATTVGVAAFAFGYATYSKLSGDRSRLGSRSLQLERRYVVKGTTSSIHLFYLFGLILSIVCLLIFMVEMNLFAELARGRISVKRVHEATVSEFAARGSSLTYLRWGAQTLPQMLCMLLIATTLYRRRTLGGPTLLLTTGLFLLAIVVPVLTSARGEMIQYALTLLILVHYYRGQFSLKRVILIGLVLITITAALGYVRQSQTSVNGVAAFSADSLALKTLGSSYFMDIGKTSVVIDTVPEQVDFLHGESFALVLLAPIPRVLWPEKPSVRISSFVGDQIYNRADNSGIPPGLIGESYLNFGWAGIAVLLAAVGWICRYLYERLVLRSTKPLSRLWYAVLIMIMTFTLLSGDLTIAVSRFVRFGLILYIGGRLIEGATTSPHESGRRRRRVPRDGHRRAFEV